MKIALFGGSFDPPHLGHSEVMNLALKELDIDKLIIMPTYISPFKSKFSADPMLRLKWVKEIWGNLDKVEILDYEIKQKRKVPSLEVVKHIYEIYKINKFYLIIGADHLENLDKWHKFEELKNLVEFVVAKRDDIAVSKEFKTINTNLKASSSSLRDKRNYDILNDKCKDEIVKFYKGEKC